MFRVRRCSAPNSSQTAQAQRSGPNQLPQHGHDNFLRQAAHPLGQQPRIDEEIERRPQHRAEPNQRPAVPDIPQRNPGRQQAEQGIQPAGRHIAHTAA